MSENTSLATQSAFDISSLNLSSDLNQYVIVAKTGTTVTQYPFERLKFEANRQQRFAILTSEVVIVKRFYHPDLGYVLAANDGSLDKYFEKGPSIVYCYPAVSYLDTTDRGKPLSDKIQVKMLQCNKEMYNFLCNLMEIKGDLTQFDFLGSQIPGTDKFPKTQILEAGNALWLNNPDNRKSQKHHDDQRGQNKKPFGVLQNTEGSADILRISELKDTGNDLNRRITFE